MNLRETLRKNLGGSPQDAFYRYKRDVAQLRVTQKGYTSTTKFLNLRQIAKDLDVLHSGDKFQEAVQIKLLKTIRKTSALPFAMKENLPVFAGTLDVTLVEKVIDDFVAKYLMCQQCHMPEYLNGTCRACGWHRE